MNRNIIQVNKASAHAKYRQIIDSVIYKVREGFFKRGDKLPSVNDIAQRNSLSRDTVLLAYNELKSRGVLKSVPGKGYYIESTDVNHDLRILLLFDEFNGFKEDLYNAFITTIAGRAQIDIFFHHFNDEVFDSIITNQLGNYTNYVVMPALLPNAHLSIKKLPLDKVFILDQLPVSLKGEYPSIYQSFDEDIYNGLRQGLELLKKYNRLILVYPGGKEPRGFFNGFKKFCEDFNFSNDVISGLTESDVLRGHVYIMPNDRDLVFLVKHCRRENYIIGDDVGIISLNDYGLKEIIADGITTISTDFKAMGENLARMIISREKVEIKNPSNLIIRGSL
ncbi:GntR family transcriptional regulator [Alkalitalea saponilacus]|uniref:Substrate-binding protein-like domain-containing protein n=1 Tax=Alkalitalea saponilacus TaxID=889453 RepID=A0A1T5HT91_9BACT|nr:GntR family transcriptional regulator [Alkalitalea saponilacus]ASB50208.1 GntR family transcriptional regulator [Alkalitalea saponilacus]SKC23939.1 substrate-binding protein-like domain-containing protein [Alkalitalea saponilacus]